jgi:hypothetical protein
MAGLKTLALALGFGSAPSSFWISSRTWSIVTSAWTADTNVPEINKDKYKNEKRRRIIIPPILIPERLYRESFNCGGFPPTSRGNDINNRLVELGERRSAGREGTEIAKPNLDLFANDQDPFGNGGVN